MTTWWRLVLGLGLLAGFAAAEDAPALKSEKEKQSYAVGVNLGNQLRKQAGDLDPALVSQGLKDALSGGKTLLTEGEVTAAMSAVKNDLRIKQAAAQAESLAKFQKEGEAFLAANKTREGVVTLESGLQYKILKAGSGKKPTDGDTVVCHYRGTLIDGTEFADTHKSKRPATFSVKGAIKGLNEALQLMPVGSTWQLFVPARLAYLTDAGGAETGPSGTVIFELELISIKGAAQPKAAASKPAGAAKSVSSGTQQQAAQNAVPAADSLSDIHVSFKVDPRLAGGTYGGERWVSTPTYSGTNGQDTVEARAEGIDRKGTSVRISPTWTPSDPAIVTVEPGQGPLVKITVKRAGTSRLLVTYGELSRELSIKAEMQNALLRADITTGSLQTKPKTDQPAGRS
jgi:FKBP-type peptidyl-prolyl cis-trans isomerase FklB